ncbi:hypothetical protein SWPG_00109 [Synechococcus phage S-CBM2]|nr:hypothetical protein SWPG_00109 [Synechococcus phage S-CBM2]
MTYDATVQFKFDATFTPTYGSGFGSTVVDDYIPEEHYLITAPAADLNVTQYFKLFEKFMLCVGMSPCSIRSGAMSLVFNDYVDEKEQRKVCKEYEITMDEDIGKEVREEVEKQLQIQKELDRITADRIFSKDPVNDHDYGDDDYWEKSYWQIRNAAAKRIRELEEKISQGCRVDFNNSTECD